MKSSSDLSRLSTEVPHGSSLGRALEAALHRGPTAEQRQALERSVFAALPPGVTASPSTREVSGAPTSGPLPAGALKLVALLALASIGTGAGVRWIRRRPAPVAVATIVQPLAVAPASAGPSGAAVEQPVAAHLGDATTSEPTASRPPPRKSASPRRTARTIDAASQDELDLLERADRALATAPEVALSLAESHARLFPEGSMEEEREVIAVSALARLGRDREARARADRFMRAHTGSAYALRIERALAPNARAIDVAH
jgi:hypothetical protein